MTKLEGTAPCLLYAEKTIEHDWSRNVLVHQALPADLEEQLPSIELIEKKLQGDKE